MSGSIKKKKVRTPWGHAGGARHRTGGIVDHRPPEELELLFEEEWNLGPPPFGDPLFEEEWTLNPPEALELLFTELWSS